VTKNGDNKEGNERLWACTATSPLENLLANFITRKRQASKRSALLLEDPIKRSRGKTVVVVESKKVPNLSGEKT